MKYEVNYKQLIRDGRVSTDGVALPDRLECQYKKDILTDISSVRAQVFP